MNITWSFFHPPDQSRAVFFLAGAVLLLGWAIAGCNLPSPTNPPLNPVNPTQNTAADFPSPQPTENIIPQDSSPAAATEVIPTSLPVPTATFRPVDPSLPDQVSVLQFRDGGTIAYYQDQIQAGEKQLFTVRAAQGQTMHLAVSSDNMDVYLGVRGLDSQETYLELSEKSSQAAIHLPDTQPYQITVFASQTAATYFLTLEIPAVVSLQPEDGAVEIPGYVDVYQEYHPGVFTRVRYQITVDAGQMLDVDLETEHEEDLTLALTGADDGQPYLRHVVKASSIDLEVPVSQAYYLDVYAITGRSAAYNLEIQIHDQN